MQPRFLIILLITFSVAPGVLSILAKYKFSSVKGTNNKERKELKENRKKIKVAGALANIQNKKMAHVLDNPDFPNRKEMIEAAFGTDDSLDMGFVRKTVGDFADKKAILPIDPATDHTQEMHAITHYTGNRTPMKPTHVSFSSKFYSDSLSDGARAATIIHEATHYLSDTGDHSVDQHMIPASDVRKGEELFYTSSEDPYKTPAELNRDKNWKRLRDGRTLYFGDKVPKTKNMHLTAESYAQFASICGHAVADDIVEPRRRLRPRSRSLEDENWGNAAVHLIRRHVCSLPQKAAASRKIGQGNSASRISAERKKNMRASTRTHASAKETGPAGALRFVKSKNGAFSPKAKTVVGDVRSQSRAFSKSHISKGLTQRTNKGSVSTSAAVTYPRPQLKVSAPKRSLALAIKTPGTHRIAISSQNHGVSRKKSQTSVATL